MFFSGVDKKFILLQRFFKIVSWKSKYNIEFKGLSEGLHNFEFKVDDAFFIHFEGSLVEKGDVVVAAELEKRSAFIKVHLKMKGWLELTCDRCLDNYRQKVKNETELFVKFGEKEFDEAENVIWVLPEEHQINLAQIIYEYVSLSIPLRHVHPKNAKGERECNPEMIEKLKKYTHFDDDENTSVDPRWNALKNLGNGKN